MSDIKRMFSLTREVFASRKLIWSLAKNDFKTKYAGSYFGVIWAFIQPIVTVLVYWFVFQKGLRSPDISMGEGVEVPFVLWLIAGIVPWFFFSDAWGAGTNTLNEYSYLVKKVVFKISILPVVKMISALFVHIAFVALVVIIYCCYGQFPDVYYLQLFYYSFCLLVLVLGLSYATSAIVVFFKDLDFSNFWCVEEEHHFPNCEKTSLFYKRIYDFIDELKSADAYEHVLVVAHGGVSLPFYTYFHGVPCVKDMRPFMLNNCEVTCYDL